MNTALAMISWINWNKIRCTTLRYNSVRICCAAQKQCHYIFNSKFHFEDKQKVLACSKQRANQCKASLPLKLSHRRDCERKFDFLSDSSLLLHQFLLLVSSSPCVTSALTHMYDKWPKAAKWIEDDGDAKWGSAHHPFFLSHQTDRTPLILPSHEKDSPENAFLSFLSRKEPLAVRTEPGGSLQLT